MVTTEVTLPDLGTGVSSGELVAWLIDPGDRVAADRPIAEIETDKSLVEIPAPAPGIVEELRVEVGAQVAEGDVVAVIDVDESAVDASADEPIESTGEATPKPDEQTATGQGDEPSVASDRVFAPPRVRRLARELHVDIAELEGTGASGRITESDVRAAAEKSAGDDGIESGPREFGGGRSVTRRRERDATSATEPTPRERSTARSVVRQRSDGEEPLAERIETPDWESSESEEEPAAAEGPTSAESTPSPRSASTGTAPSAVTTPSPATAPATAVGSSASGPQTTHYDEVDVTAMRAARRRLAAAGVADGAMTDLAFVVAAVAAAAESVPALNGPIEGGEIDRRDRINVAIAVPTDEGLVAPVVVDADDVAFPILAQEVGELIERAKAGALAPAETADGTVTVTDFGALGGTYATPNVAAMGTSVLALGEIRERPRLRDGALSARAILPLSAAIDSRAADGTDAAQFLTEVRRYLNTPELLLLND